MIGFKRWRLLAGGVFAFALVVGAGFWVWQWWQRKNAPFVCPVPRRYCARAKRVRLRDGSPALGFQVPAGTRVLAGFSGLASQGASKRPDGKVRQSVQIETNDGRKLYYAFVGRNLVQMQTVVPGQPLGAVEDEGEAVRGTGVNLVVYFRDKDGQIKPLSPRDFR